MDRFLIEVDHEVGEEACLKAIQVLLATGSHYLTHADFGCMDGEHRAWIIVEADDRDQARSILPPVYRSSAKVVKLNKFSLAQIDALLERHKGSTVSDSTA